VDGALLYNNPIELAYQEAQTLWPNDKFIFVSLGTGLSTEYKSGRAEKKKNSSLKY